jgi:hypothetical protein
MEIALFATQYKTCNLCTVFSTSAYVSCFWFSCYLLFLLVCHLFAMPGEACFPCFWNIQLSTGIVTEISREQPRSLVFCLKRPHIRPHSVFWICNGLIPGCWSILDQMVTQVIVDYCDCRSTLARLSSYCISFWGVKFPKQRGPNHMLFLLFQLESQVCKFQSQGEWVYLLDKNLMWFRWYKLPMVRFDFGRTSWPLFYHLLLTVF